MSPQFLFLMAAAGILRFLSADSKKAFNERLRRLLPRKVMRDHMRALMEDYPEHLREFRRRVLPFSALHVGLNAAVAACFVTAVWSFPPGGMEHWDLVFVQYGSLFLTPVALLADVVLLARTLMATYGRNAEADRVL
jgi:hypothetical protein